MTSATPPSDVRIATEPAARARLWWEIGIVLAVTVGQSALYSVLSLVRASLRTTPIGQQQTQLNPNRDAEVLWNVLYQFLGIVFDIGVYAAIVSALRTTRLGLGRVDRLWVALAAYAILGVLVATVAFLLTQPAFSRWDPVVALYKARPALPMEAMQLLGKIGLGNPHPNRVADVLTLFLPCYLALLLYRPWHGSGEHGVRRDDGRLRRLVLSRWLPIGCSLAVCRVSE